MIPLRSFVTTVIRGNVDELGMSVPEDTGRTDGRARIAYPREASGTLTPVSGADRPNPGRS